jgi:hypothetical protein
MMIIIVIMIMQEMRSWMVILMPLLFPAAVQVSLILQGTIQRQTHIYSRVYHVLQISIDR